MRLLSFRERARACDARNKHRGTEIIEKNIGKK